MSFRYTLFSNKSNSLHHLSESLIFSCGQYIQPQMWNAVKKNVFFFYWERSVRNERVKILCVKSDFTNSQISTPDMLFSVTSVSDICICVYFTKLFCDTHLWSVLCSMMTWILAHWQWWCRRRQVNRACCLQCVGALNSQACCPMLFPYPLRESDFVKEDRSVEQEHRPIHSVNQ